MHLPRFKGKGRMRHCRSNFLVKWQWRSNLLGPGPRRLRRPGPISAALKPRLQSKSPFPKSNLHPSSARSSGEVREDNESIRNQIHVFPAAPLPLRRYDAWSVLCHLDDDLAHMLLRLQVRIRLDGFLERKDLVHDRMDLASDEEEVHILEPKVPTSELCVHQSPTRN